MDDPTRLSRMEVSTISFSENVHLTLLTKMKSNKSRFEPTTSYWIYNSSYHYTLYEKVITTRIRRMGKILFLQVCVCP